MSCLLYIQERWFVFLLWKVEHCPPPSTEYIGNGQAGADGAYGAVHASGFFVESDIRLKSDIAPLKHTLDQICNIPTVEFNMHDKHQIGTIA